LTVFCEDVRTARPELRAATEEQARIPTLVAIEWESAPSLAAELDEIRDALARAAASTWPDWYLSAEQRLERKRPESVTLAEVVTEVRGAPSKPSVAWLKSAWSRADKRQLPLVPPLTSAEQVRQLSRALDPETLIFVLSVESAEASDARVRGLARAAEWLAHESQAKVILLVPLAWQGHRELDHVAYRALVLLREAAASSHGSAAPAKASGTATEAPDVLVGPVVGKPHPGSDVERLMQELLGAASDLRDLFEYNQFITVFGDQRIKPDLLWRTGGLAIEIDGDEHCRPSRYYQDRDRDYRLYLSGYVTLRITNPEVYQAPGAVLEKIRNVVNRLKRSAARSSHDQSA
jgi:Protein of unknown function (DUF559)